MAEREGPHATLARLAAEGHLALQRCEAGGAPIFYPRVLCPACAATRLRWERSIGRGTVYATTAVNGRDAPPRNVALVDLDEGVRIMTTVRALRARR